MNLVFYQRFWDIIGTNVVKECLQILLSGTIPRHFNDTSVVLIPNKKNLEYITDIRKISLCNVMVKIITKMLANLLNKLLPLIFSDE